MAFWHNVVKGHHLNDVFILNIIDEHYCFPAGDRTIKAFMK